MTHALRIASVVGLLGALAMVLGCSPEAEREALEADLRQAALTNQPMSIDPGHGVGPVRFGMSRAEVHEAIGDPYRTTGGADEYQLLGFAVLYDADDRVNVIFIGAWCEPSDILLDVFNGETTDGLELRSPRPEVLEVLGEPLMTDELATGFEVFRYTNEDYAIRDGHLVHITLRRPPGQA